MVQLQDSQAQEELTAASLTQEFLQQVQADFDPQHEDLWVEPVPLVTGVGAVMMMVD